MKGLVIAGTQSGAGKTTITLGLMAALRRRGLRVAPFKVGPDFIDPGHHTRVTGCASRNLDGWMLPRDWNREHFRRHAQGADIAVVEGVMGLYDGFSGTSEEGSTAQMAKWLDLTVVLVVNARSMARSAAALVQGFERFDPGVRFAGVVFNNLGSERHRDYLMEALAGNVRMDCLGGLLRSDQLAIPERHLGLVTTEDHGLSPKAVDRLADHVENGIDMDRLMARLPAAATGKADHPPSPEVDRPVATIAVAMDAAFCFYYRENLEMLRAAGAQLVMFSPLEDSGLPRGIDGLYLGGGYPELHACRLSENRELRRQIREASRSGLPVYAECGGFMYLLENLRDLDGKQWPMCGCFSGTAAMHARLRTLGYREVTLTGATPLGNEGCVLRGHEFHYSGLENNPAEVQRRYAVTARDGRPKETEGYLRHRTLGSYIHLHFGSCPGAARNFVHTCMAYRNEREQRR